MGDAVGVAVGLGVGVAVGLGVGVAVGLGVGVAVGLGVGVTVGIGVGVTTTIVGTGVGVAVGVTGTLSVAAEVYVSMPNVPLRVHLYCAPRRLSFTLETVRRAVSLPEYTSPEGCTPSLISVQPSPRFTDHL